MLNPLSPKKKKLQIKSSKPAIHFYLLQPMFVLREDNSDFDVTVGSYYGGRVI